MKQARVHQRSARQNRTSAAIALPPPKPPVASSPSNANSAKMAVPLPQGEEPLINNERAPSRQLRRQQRRAKAKTARRAQSSTAAVPQAATAPATESLVADTQPAPLPRNRALAKPRSRFLTVIDRWLRPSKTPAIVRSELEALRNQIRTVQRTLDRLLTDS